jgi:pyruvate,orthophosphate dikinase
MEEAMPEAYAELAAVFELLEKHYRDMQDIEFTVERGKLWMLQTRGQAHRQGGAQDGGRYGR